MIPPKILSMRVGEYCKQHEYLVILFMTHIASFTEYHFGHVNTIVMLYKLYLPNTILLDYESVYWTYSRNEF